jgi:hypothetical protein
MHARVPLLAAAGAFLVAPAVAGAQAPNAVDVPLAEGGAVHVVFTDAAGGVNPDLAAQYVGYLDSIPHGSELRKLLVQIASPDQIAGLCGGLETDGILACYEPGHNRMNVPNVGLDATTAGGTYSLRYVLTHEYGHHIAHHRSNPGFRGGALDWGPKLWSSQELVCNGVQRGQLFPSDEGGHYRANPGEAWAEAYARLVFPDQPWNFTGRLTPDAVDLDAARRDVVEPWTKNRGVASFTMTGRRHSQAFTVPLNLDGTVKVLVQGPRGSEVGARLTLRGRTIARSGRRGRTDTLTRAAVCRSTPTQNLTVTASRRGHSGPVKVLVSYPG